MLNKEFKYFLDNQNELVDKYPGKYLVIIGCDVIGAFDSIGDAYNNTQAKYELGTFYIQQAVSGEESYTHIINRYSY